MSQLLDFGGNPAAPPAPNPTEAAPATDAPRLTDPLTPLQAMILLEGVTNEDDARHILLWANRTRAQARVLELAMAGLAVLTPSDHDTVQFRLLTDAEVRERWQLAAQEAQPDAL